jgi:hypothetical protein
MRPVIVLALAGGLLAPSTATAASKNCGNRVYAGKNTSCGLAKALFKKIGRDSENIADGKRVRVRSPANGNAYTFVLWRADARSFTCRAKANGVLSVRIAT